MKYKRTLTHSENRLEPEMKLARRLGTNSDKTELDTTPQASSSHRSSTITVKQKIKHKNTNII